MNKKHNLQIRNIFLHSVELPESERENYISKTTDDPEIKKRVLELLETYKSHTLKTEDMVSDIADNISRSSLLFPSDRYTLIKKIGQGGMGDVFLAQRNVEGVKQQVAIKILFHDDTVSKQRFSQETSILSQLSHPNISNFIDADFLTDGRPYVVMEYTPGEKLTDYCRNRELSVNQRIQIFIKLCKAVQHAHQNLIIHRDIKPENILVNDSGEPKLLDFGIAKIIEGTGDRTRTQMRALTPAYASPEQFLGKAVSVSSDVYSLGVVLYELLSGMRPNEPGKLSPVEFEKLLRESDTIKPSDSLIKLYQQKPDRKLHNRIHKLKGDLDMICAKSLQYDVSQRYQTVAELIDDLKRYLNNHPVLAQAPKLGYRFKKFVQRHKVSLSASLIVLMMISGFIYLLIHQRDIAIREQIKAQTLSDIFIQAFEMADPTRTNGEEISALQILEEAKSLILNLSSDSVIKSQLLLVITEVYRHLYQFDPIRELLDEIEKDYSKLDHSEKIHFKSEYVFNSFRNGMNPDLLIDNINKAIDELGEDPSLLYTKAFISRITTRYDLVINEVGPYFQKLNQNDKYFIPICSLYGYALASSGERKKGEKIYQKCLSVMELDPEDRNTLELSNLLFQMGRLNIDLKKYNEAINYFEKSKEIRKNLYKNENVAISDIDIYIGNALVLLNQPDEALPYIENAIHGRKIYYPDNISSLSKPYFSKGKALLKLGKLTEAEKFISNAIQLRIDAGVEMAPNTAFQYQYLGRLYVEMNKFQDAIYPYKRCIEIFSMEKYNSIYRVAETKVLLADVYYKINDLIKAKQLLSEAMPDMYTMHDEKDEIRVLGEQLQLQLSDKIK